MPTRHHTSDILKTASIFGVVYIHSYSRYDNLWTEMLSDLFRIAVPCFIILFAYFFEKSILKGKGFKYIFSRFSHMLLVFVAWSTIYLFSQSSHRI